VPSGTALLGWRCPRHFVPGYDRTVPSGTALLGWRCPRHFVPGYDRTVPSGTALLGWRCPRHFVPGYDRTVPSVTLRNRPLVRRPDFRNESRRCGENSLEMVNCWDPSGSAGGHRDWCDRNHCGLGRRGYRSGRGRNWGDRTVHPIGIFRSS
jgi:hypothetical protein